MNFVIATCLLLFNVTFLYNYHCSNIKVQEADPCRKVTDTFEWITLALITRCCQENEGISISFQLYVSLK